VDSHNNQSNASAPLNKVADAINATWTTPDGKFAQPYTFNITVPVVRPDHETGTIRFTHHGAGDRQALA
jgi:hypothetical protein